MLKSIETTLNNHTISQWGICSLQDLAPLISCRAASRLPVSGKRVIVALFPYYLGDFPQRNIARYAIADDYHHTVGQLLDSVSQQLSAIFPEDAFVPFVDNSPLPEVRAARLAGLGVIGRNGQLIHKKYGSYAFIGAIVTSLSLPVSSPISGSCLNCSACIHACPTGALTTGNPLDKAKCRSFITQKKGTLTDWEAKQIQFGGMVWGCDKCLDACPMNRNVTVANSPYPQCAAAPWLDLDNLEELHPHKAYNYRPRQVLERNWRLIYQHKQQE